MRQTLALALALSMCLAAGSGAAQVSLLDDVARTALKGAGLLDQAAPSFRGGSDEAARILRSARSDVIVSSCGLYGARDFLVEDNSVSILGATVRVWGDILDALAELRVRLGADGPAQLDYAISQYENVLKDRKRNGTISDGEKVQLLTIELYGGRGDFLECVEVLQRLGVSKILGATLRPELPGGQTARPAPRP